jgi:hypothetical protein
MALAILLVNASVLAGIAVNALILAKRLALPPVFG